MGLRRGMVGWAVALPFCFSGCTAPLEHDGDPTRDAAPAAFDRGGGTDAHLSPPDVRGRDATRGDLGAADADAPAPDLSFLPDAHGPVGDLGPIGDAKADILASDARAPDLAVPGDFAVPADVAQDGSEPPPADAFGPAADRPDLPALPDIPVLSDVPALPPDAAPPPVDSDADGIPDLFDLCPAAPDPFQRDADGDRLGDACDRGDTDQDGVADLADLCPTDPSPTADTDADGTGDACDLCPAAPDAAQLDQDADGIGDACEIPGDDDADGSPDAQDVCPRVFDPAQLDRDGDGLGDLCDTCPAVPDPVGADADADGQGDACDPCPFVPEAGTDHLDVDGDGLPACAGDCDDEDAGRALDHAERCDGRDNDCDDEIDEIFLDLSRACSAGVGTCRVEGEIRCAGGGSTACDAQAGAPELERCDGLDNDCDGTSDEDVAACCAPGDEVPCGSDVGECAAGVQLCGADRAWGECSGLGPSAEICNDADDDCDGVADEELGERDCGVGRCLHRVPICDPSNQHRCEPLLGAIAEICNGTDDDCDGQVDEGLGRIDCGCGVSVPACVAGARGVCAAAADTVTPETCDGRDNDCNGLVDDVHGVPTRRIPIADAAQGLRNDPQLAISGGRILVAWTDVGGRLCTAVADTAGAIVTPARCWPDVPAGQGLRVIAGPDGRFAVTWVTSTVPYTNIFATFSADGLFQSAVAIGGATSHLPAAPAFNGVDFGYAWYEQSPQGNRVAFAPMDIRGQPGAVPRPLGNANGNATDPTLAWNGTTYAFAFNRSSGGDNIAFQFVDRAGAAIGGLRAVTPQTRNESDPHLFWTGADYVLTWMTRTNGALTSWTVRLDANGLPISVPETPIPGTVAFGVGIVPTADGYAIYGYRTAPTLGVVLQRYDAAGRRVANPEMLARAMVAFPDAFVWTGTMLAAAWTELTPQGLSRPYLVLGEATCDP